MFTLAKRTQFKLLHGILIRKSYLQVARRRVLSHSGRHKWEARKDSCIELKKDMTKQFLAWTGTQQGRFWLRQAMTAESFFGVSIKLMISFRLAKTAK